MKNNKIRETAEIVKRILEKNEKARNNDNLLICLVVEQFGLIAQEQGEKRFTWNAPFYAILDLIDKKKIPTLETITRCRRKAQELYPELRSKEQVEDARLEKTVDYINFAKDKKI